ncbi:MAG: toluene tolerance protein [Proteobacteria bacterium]|jgi:ABC-type transport system involved in resistance to organic solvents, auxiliary component|nr:MAG: toluene tolerance protein [Pseudomonadota bacterium]
MLMSVRFLFGRFGMATQVATRKTMSRGRHSLIALFSVLWLLIIGAPAKASSDAAAIQFMKDTARELIAAARSGSQRDFMEVIQKRGHVPAIGLYALGNYKAQLPASHRDTYYGGMVRFIARYASTEAPKYPVSHAEILSPVVREGDAIYVDSRVHLQNGSVYDVRWLLIPQGNSFRIRDAQVMGFWMSPFLKKLFEDYIGENGGDPQALVIALSR